MCLTVLLLAAAVSSCHRMIIVGSITGNTNTLAGNVPPKADLGDLSGLTSNASMIDGKEFDGAKAYKDSKVSLEAVVCMV
jgi:hypothetical protein